MAQPNTQTQQNNTHKDVKNTSHATDTSKGMTSQDKHDSASVWQKHLTSPLKQASGKGHTKRCNSSVRRFSWKPWINVVSLLVDLRRRVPGVSLNRVLNEAFLLWLGAKCDDELRLRSRLAQLLHEEHELMQTGRVVLRSGAFLDSYAAKLMEGNEELSARLGRQPLGALADKREVNVVKRLLARREAVVEEILSIQDKLLPKDEYVLKSRRRRQDTSHIRKECAESNSGVDV